MQLFSSHWGSAGWVWKSMEPQECSEFSEIYFKWVHRVVLALGFWHIDCLGHISSDVGSYLSRAFAPSPRPLRKVITNIHYSEERMLCYPSASLMAFTSICASLVVRDLKQAIGDLGPGHPSAWKNSDQCLYLWAMLRKGRGRRLCLSLAIHWQRESRGKGRI